MPGELAAMPRNRGIEETMALKAFVTDLESVDENLRGLYVQDGERYRLDAEGVEDVSGLKSALERQKADARKSREQLEKLGTIDPEEYQRLKAEAEQREAEKAEKAGEWDKLRKQLADQHAKQMEAEKSEKQRMEAALHAYLIDGEASRAIAAAKGAPDLLLPHVRAQVRVVSEDGKYIARVINPDGSERLADDGTGAPMTIPQLVESMKKSSVYGRAFDGDGISGLGSKPGQGSGTAKLKAWDGKATLKDKVEFLKRKHESIP